MPEHPSFPRKIQPETIPTPPFVGKVGLTNISLLNAKPFFPVAQPQKIWIGVVGLFAETLYLKELSPPLFGRLSFHEGELVIQFFVF